MVHALTRKTLWRAGRKLYCWARGDLANNPELNGEYWLLNEFVHASHDQPLLFDVGANRGDWTLRALTLAQRAGKPVFVSAFEPCAATRNILQARLNGYGNVQVSASALSSAEGEADFFSNGVGSGTNSLNAISGSTSERVQLVTLDSFSAERGIDQIGMLKIDTEGYDFGVLQGAHRMLSGGCIELVQFEYNWRWLLNKASLLDVFSLIQGMPYRVGKLMGGAIEFYDTWHFELDRFFENNYVLVRKDSSLQRLGRTVRFDSSNCPQATGAQS